MVPPRAPSFFAPTRRGRVRASRPAEPASGRGVEAFVPAR